MRVGIATDHGGFALKEELVARIRAAGHEVMDFGAHRLNANDDYPDFVVPLSEAVAAGTVDRGVAICGSGVGASVCANKIPGIRAALIHDNFSARQGVEDDHMNILCMGGRTVGPAVVSFPRPPARCAPLLTLSLRPRDPLVPSNPQVIFGLHFTKCIENFRRAGTAFALGASR